MGARFSYIILAGALLAAAVAAGVATWLEWLPCRGTMLNGSILLGFQYPSEFSDACLSRMDSRTMPPLAAGAVELRALSALLLGVGWLGCAAKLPLSGISRLVALLPVVPVSWFGVETWLSGDTGSTVTMGAIELTGAAAAVVILTQPSLKAVRLPALVGLWAVTAYGLAHAMGEYALMVMFSDAHWDLPPGTGYLTAAMIAVSALFVVWVGRRTAGRPEPGGGATSGLRGDRSPAHSA